MLARDITLAFARISVKTIEPSQTLSAGPLFEVLVRALSHQPPASGPIRSFLPPDDTDFHFHPGMIGGSVILGEGETYTAVDRRTGTKVKGTYSQPPLRGSALFVIDSEGWITIDKKATPNLTPESILSLVAVRVRETASPGQYINVNTSLLTLHDETSEVVEYVKGLDTLTSVTFADLRAPNPHEQSDVLERARVARIRKVTEESDDNRGIDRESDLIRDELAHAERGYARIRGVAGTKDSHYSGLRVQDESTELDIHIEGKSERELLERMHEQLTRLRRKLRRSGREPL